MQQEILYVAILLLVIITLVLSLKLSSKVSDLEKYKSSFENNENEISTMVLFLKTKQMFWLYEKVKNRARGINSLHDSNLEEKMAMLTQAIKNAEKEHSEKTNKVLANDSEENQKEA